MSMRFQGEFETIKMIEQAGKVTCCTEHAEGQLLMYYIHKKEPIEKEQLWRWLHSICTQLYAYHRCYHRAYQYVNPYTFLLTNENTIKLLDLDDQSNESVLIYLQKNIIRESFSRANSLKRTKVYTDFYGFGKTLQFILSQGNVTPQVNRAESYKLSKIIKKCLENTSEITFQNIKEIQNQLPKIKKTS